MGVIMNYFKLLLTTLLATSASTSCMEKPTTATLSNQQFDLRIKAGLDGEEKCAICRKKAKFLAGDSLRFTKCCWQFICAHDLELKKELFKDEADQCPFCHKYLSVEKIALSNENISFPIIDNYGVEVDISNFADCQAIKQCSMIAHARAGCQGIFDFREKNASATFTNIKLLIDYIKNPRLFQFQSFLTNKEMLRLADYLGAPENILFELANILWMDLQDKASDSKEAKEEKLLLRAIAEPYLYCPEYYFKLNPGIFDALKNNIQKITLLDLSHAAIGKLDWIVDENGLLYSTRHKFVTLRGLKAFLKNLSLSAKLALKSVNLSGHNIKHFDSNEITDFYFYEINLSKNQIESIIVNPNSAIRGNLNLQNNKITSLDDNFFNCIRNMRAKNSGIIIDLRNNPISVEQKMEISKRWNKAIDMLPERIYDTSTKVMKPVREYSLIPAALAGAVIGGIGAHTFSKSASGWLYYPFTGLGAALGCIAGLGTGILAKNSGEDYWTTSVASAATGSFIAGSYLHRANPQLTGTKLLALPTALILGGAIGGVLGLASYAIIKPLLKHVAAPLVSKITHPGIGWNDSSTVWVEKQLKPELYL